MKSSVTIVVPIFNLTTKRLRNFCFLLENYVSKLSIPIIVIEQVRDYESTKAGLFIKSLNCSEISYIPVACHKNIFLKSYIVNYASTLVKTKYMWTLDADVFLRYPYVLETIDDQDIICPFENVFLLNETQTLKFINSKQLIVAKGSKFKSISKFGPLSMVIKTEIFRKTLMDERFTGWGWEDLDFAYRVTQKYQVTRLEANGLHLYHEVSELNPEQEKNNRQIFFETRKQLTFNGIKTSIPLEQSSLANIISQASRDTLVRPRIIHIFSPALLPNKKELYNREIIAIESIIKNKTDYVTTIMVCDSPEAQKYKDDFEVIGLQRSSKDIGDKRNLPYLSDLFKKACELCSDNDIIFYTNSDCFLSPGAYGRLANSESEAIEYHRRDTEAKSLKEMLVTPSAVKETGVDGLAFRKKFYLDNAFLVPDFFIGEPHWDTAICGALRTKNVSSQNVIDLYHPIHEQTWNPNDLSLAGKHNDKIYRDFLEYGISDIRLLSVPEEKIETSVVLVHYGKDEKRISAAKRAMSKICYQNILNVEFIFIDVISGKTLFPEVDVWPNWVHITLEEKESNKDIFQKEAMMNIGGKIARGQVVIFVDSDVWSENQGWLDSISKKVKLNPDQIVHGFSFCQDSKYPEKVYMSAGLNTCKNIESNVAENPGLVIGISKEVLTQNTYFNAYHIMGGGDSILVHEYAGGSHPSYRVGWQSRFPKIKNIIRKLPVNAPLDYVDIPIIHENHGDVNFRYYAMRYFCLDYFTKEIKELVKMGENNLLEWVDPNCIERKILQRKYEFLEEKITRDICEEIIGKYKT